MDNYIVVGDPELAPDVPESGEVSDVWKAMGYLGAKNLIPYPYYHSNGHTSNGISYTVNNDGSVVANGTKNTATVSQFYFFLDNNSTQFGYQTDLFEVGKTYRLTGCPSGGYNSYTYQLRLILNYNKSGEGLTSYTYADKGQGITFTIQSEIKYARLMIDIGNQSATYSVSDLLFKPMLRLAEDTDETYRPYAMTNKQLTDMLHPIGTIIESTTCDTMAKVVATYGGKTWIQHSGYVLRGATSGVTSNDATKTGGSDNAIVVSHNHTFTGTEVTSGTNSANPSVTGGAVTGGITGGSHRHAAVKYRNNIVASGSNHTRIVGQGDTTFNGTYYTDYTTHTHDLPAHTHTVSGTHTHKVTASGTISTEGSSGTSANIPNYKSVYIWERTA